jgi:hypothetical protein
MLFVLPVAKARQIAVGTGLTIVLSGGLPVHLQDGGARPAEHATQQVHVVHCDRGGGRLVRLVEALQHGRHGRR